MKKVKDFRDDDFARCDVPEKYWGDYPHANFFRGEFIPIARKEFKALAKKLGAEVSFSPMYFEWSAFFKKDGKFIYVHVGDVRYNICGHWYDNVLYRTAESEKDFTGGYNNFCPYEDLEKELSALFERMVA